MADERLKQLADMTRDDLLRLAAGVEPALDYKPYWPRKRIAQAIRKRELEPEISAETEAGGGEQPTNPDFEEALGIDDLKDGRGGAREGTGRAPGETNEYLKVKNLPKVPNQSIKAGVFMLGGLWAERVKIPLVAFTEVEAHEIALRVTQLQEYYMPGKIPEIAYVWLSLIGTIYAVADSRIKIINAARASVKPESENAKS